MYQGNSLVIIPSYNEAENIVEIINDVLIQKESFHLLIVDDNSRKLCFNTYNGTLGKRGNSLPIEAFQNDEMPEGKRLWFHVKDVDKQRQKLSKDGYERV